MGRTAGKEAREEVEHAFLDKYSGLDSPVHRLDPRAKVVGTVFLVAICVTTPPTLVAAFAAYLALELALLSLSRLPWRHVLKRYLVVLPFVAAVALVVPFLSQGGGSYNLGPLRLHGRGLLVLWNVAVKSTVSVLAVILLSSTTPFPELLKAMRELRVPALLVNLLSFAYRYIFVLVDEAQRMQRARDSRGWNGRWLWQSRVVGNMVASLFLRSYERGERVYAAMLARGYDGEIRSLYPYAFGTPEVAFLCLVVLTPLGARLLSSG